MPESHSLYIGDVPKNYQEHMVPVMFEPYAQELSSRVQVGPDAKVLELAAGTGVVTRHLLKKLPSSVQIVATDLNEEMIDIGKHFTSTDKRLQWKAADAQDLPFDDGEFDAVVAAFGVMFFPDKIKAFKEARRVLKPGGTFHFTVWCYREDQPHAFAAQETLKEFFPENTPDFYDTPFGHADVTKLAAQAKAAGFLDFSAHYVPKEARAISARSLATGLIEGFPVSHIIAERGQSTAKVIDRLTEKLTRIGGADPYVSHLRAIVFAAKAPL